jgi:hypothetical protein
VRCTSAGIDDQIGLERLTVVASHTASLAIAAYEIANSSSCLDPDAWKYLGSPPNHVFDQTPTRTMPFQDNVEGLSYRAGSGVGSAIGQVPDDVTSDPDPVCAEAPKILREAGIECREYLLAAIQQGVKVIALRDRFVNDRTILDFVALENRHLVEMVG